MSPARLVLAIVFSIAILVPARADTWPAWRGPSGDGRSDVQNAPLNWSASKHVIWKTALPGPGNSSPVVTADRVFVTVALEAGAQRLLMCFDRKSGKALWRRAVTFAPDEITHKTNPYCSASPATDGASVFVSHGSAGVAAYDLAGEKRWHRDDLGAFDQIWGSASSPVLYRETVILLGGPGTNAFLIAMDKKTGKTAWRRELPEAEAREPKHFYGAWGTPVLRTHHGRDELLIGLPRDLRAFDPATGADLLRCGGLGDLVYTSVIHDRDVVVSMSGYGGPAIAVETPAGATGDLTDKHRLWRVPKGNPQRVGSGVIVGEHIYILNDNGIAWCIGLRDGQVVNKVRLGRGKSWGSMVHAAGRIYVTNTGGQTFALEPTPEMKILATNELDELTRASPAVLEGRIFIRTYEHLWCLGPV